MIHYRNPAGTQNSPWCYVERSKGDSEIEVCAVDKCFNEWLSYAMIFAVILMLLCILFMYIICRCTVKKRTVTSIENVSQSFNCLDIYLTQSYYLMSR